MSISCGFMAENSTSDVVWNGKRVPFGRKAPQWRTDPTPRDPAENNEQNGQGEPSDSVLVAFPRVSDKGVGGREGGKK